MNANTDRLRNIAALGGRSTAARRAEIRRAVEAFRAAVLERASDDPFSRAIAEGAVVLYAALLRHQLSCSNPRRASRQGDLLAASAGLTSLRSALTQLGLAPAGPSPESPEERLERIRAEIAAAARGGRILPELAEK